jgi:hypothetical protein
MFYTNIDAVSRLMPPVSFEGGQESGDFSGLLLPRSPVAAGKRLPEGLLDVRI